MKVRFEFMSELIGIRDQIQALTTKRDEIIAENSSAILDKVYGMMDWQKDDIERATVEYSNFEKRIMIEIFLKKDRCARYIFELSGKSELNLRFREDFSKSY